MDIARRLFPDSRVFERGPHRFEAQGLPTGAQPENCDIIRQGEAKFGTGSRNTHYLVRLDTLPLYVRISAAQPEAGGGEFAALEVPSPSETTAEFEARILAKLAALTRPASAHPPVENA